MLNSTRQWKLAVQFLAWFFCHRYKLQIIKEFFGCDLRILQHRKWKLLSCSSKSHQNSQDSYKYTNSSDEPQTKQTEQKKKVLITSRSLVLVSVYCFSAWAQIDTDNITVFLVIYFNHKTVIREPLSFNLTWKTSSQSLLSNDFIGIIPQSVRIDHLKSLL